MSSEGGRGRRGADVPDGTYRRYLAAVVLFHLTAAERVSLGATDYQALSLLQLEGPLSSGALAARTGLSTGAVTRLVDRLVGSGLARRVDDPADRRRVLVEHTGSLPPGLAEILDEVRAPVGEVVEGLSDAAKKGLVAYLDGAGRAYLEATRRLRAGSDRPVDGHIPPAGRGPERPDGEPGANLG